ncbi:hypothetical protein B0H16DRAFT_701855 [Mycena metata]|uniref:Uncharacterized protein n=1 Tax=Mycena metata TaxID=1033252 RepID=A0AAD7GUL5_9AGAR|nr:hypothetical protein B0H16DRAFT_701855 [Mycena metata]
MPLSQFGSTVIGRLVYRLWGNGGEAAADQSGSVGDVSGQGLTTAANEPRVLRGGYGGVGGDADRDGGIGGNGQGPQIAPEELGLYSHITGGFGGAGGYGKLVGGTGGVGERPDFMRKLYTGEIGADMSLEDFYAQFNLDDDILDRLRKFKFKTVGALAQVTDVELGREGFSLAKFRN